MKKLGCMLMAVLMAVAVSGCSDKKEASENKETEKKVTLILDYLPNSNHTGFYGAKEKGFFKEEGLEVDIIEPGDDSTSATLVAANKGEFGVSYQEDVTYARTAEEPLPIRAIATIIQHNTSGFVSLKKENIKIDKLVGHGGIFKTPVVGKRILASAMEAPVTVMETAGEGGAWGIALLAAYQLEENLSLSDFLEQKVFATSEGVTIEPTTEDLQGYSQFIDRYEKGLSIEAEAITSLK